MRASRLLRRFSAFACAFFPFHTRCNDESSVGSSDNRACSVHAAPQSNTKPLTPVTRRIVTRGKREDLALNGEHDMHTARGRPFSVFNQASKVRLCRWATTR